MRALRPSELLDVWDAGEGHHSVERALALLRAAEPELSREELAALDVAEPMGAAAAVADVSVALACPACEERWTSLLDLPSYLWTELGAEARRLLADVDALARAYGWSEDVVLALPARRRRAYLELALS